LAGPARLTAATSPRHQPGNRYLNAHNAYNSSENTDHLAEGSDQPIAIRMEVIFDIDKRVTREYDRESKRLRRRGLLG
jgi:hypothetical protein